MTVKEVINQLSKYPQDRVVGVVKGHSYIHGISFIHNDDDMGAIIIEANS